MEYNHSVQCWEVKDYKKKVNESDPTLTRLEMSFYKSEKSNRNYKIITT